MAGAVLPEAACDEPVSGRSQSGRAGRSGASPAGPVIDESASFAELSCPGVDGEVLCAFEEVAGAPDRGRVGAGDPQVVQAEPPRDPGLAVGTYRCQVRKARQDDQVLASAADVGDRGKTDPVVRSGAATSTR